MNHDTSPVGKNKVREALHRIKTSIGNGISEISFELLPKSDGTVYGLKDFDLALVREEECITVFAGKCGGVEIAWEFRNTKGGCAVRLDAKRENGPDIVSIRSLIIKYAPDTGNLKEWRVLQRSADFVSNPIGFPALKDIEGVNPCSTLTGIFPDNKKTGLFLGTVFPQNSRHHYEMNGLEDGSVEFICTTHFITTLSGGKSLHSETTWICAGKNVSDAFNSYAALFPTLFADPRPIIGWNSWDYYFFTISSDSMIENMEEIKKDPVLADKIKYVVVDEGWEHMVGEWQPNYKFPGGLKRLAKEISDRGFIPGIWTAPLLVHTLSYAGLRMPDIFVRNEYGDPFNDGGHYLVDPTAPAGREFLKELFMRLYKAGFRFFKVDFVSNLLHADRFYNEAQGPYGAIRELFAIIRECVTSGSHILGCSLPEECGPGIADSGRTGIDIHNQWTHLEWAVECFTFKYWMHNRIWLNDPDFLVVRGNGTSLEAETNVLNPAVNNPDPQGFYKRWRRGPVFTLEEARTWTNFVLLTGGSVFSSDRIAMLNEQGKSLLRKGMQTTGVPAVPLDLCRGYHAAFWLQKLESEYRLTIINWTNETWKDAFDFQMHSLPAPVEVKDFWTGKNRTVKDRRFDFELTGHASIVVSWRYE